MPDTPVRIRLGARENETETEKIMSDVRLTGQALIACLMDLAAGEASRHLGSVPVVDNVPTLPYAWTWEAWADHVEGCSQCAHVVHETEDQAVEDLCWEGKGLNYGITAKINKTRGSAYLN